MDHDPGGSSTEERTFEMRSADDVRLVADLARPADPRAAVVLTHPHPDYGGDRHSAVTDALFRGLPERGVAALRFDFRGAGQSDGSHEGGRGERLDVEAAIDHLVAAVPGVPVVVAGWSFGGDVALSVGDGRLVGWVAVAAPLGLVPVAEMVAAHDPRPKLLLVPQFDQLRTPESAEQEVAGWTATAVEVVPGADHLLAGHHAQVIDAVAGFALAFREPPARSARGSAGGPVPEVFPMPLSQVDAPPAGGVGPGPGMPAAPPDHWPNGEPPAE